MKSISNNTNKSYRDIKFIWHSNWYLKENIYHVLFWWSIIFGLMFLAIGTTFSMRSAKVGESFSFSWSYWYSWFTVIGYGMFGPLSITFKIKQRKWRKIRVNDEGKYSKSKII
ncbi:MAG: hypothetical protein LBM76_00945 [Mycoplasmataceae bacterium]|jgi:hypothetical protein|nr:hypothetical protein [Mycoplasmataceae bacterium]